MTTNETLAKKNSRLKQPVYQAWICFLVIAAAVSFLSFFFIKTHDDYFWQPGSSVKEFWEGVLFYGNGRFLGNAMGTFFCLNPIPNYFMHTFLILAFILLLAVCADSFSVKALLLSAFLFFGMSLRIFAQAIVWSSGFYNFFPPMVMLLLSLYLLKRFYIFKEKKQGLYCALLAVLGFCQQLFSENSTAIISLAALLCALALIIKKVPGKAPAFTYLAASGIGAATMFFLPTLLNVSDKMHSYRGSVFSASKTVSETFMGNIKYISHYLICFSLIWLLLTIMQIIKLYFVNKNTITAPPPAGNIYL